MAIPKIIHYCWFGRNPKPKLANQCIKSWKKYCPSYEIVEWNEDNFDVSTAPLYVRQAYEAKKWAFVTDYVRLYAMTKYGGIYMDTDVELLKTLDEFLACEAFSGFEDDVHIPTGIMACEKGFPLFETFLHYYDSICFANADGTYNDVTNVIIMTEICLEHGLVQNGEYQIVDGFSLYPRDFFCPLECESGRLRKTKNTVCIHWFNGSWLPKELMQRRIKNKREIQRKDFVHNLLHVPHYIVRLVLGDSNYEKLKKILISGK